jgi:thiol-disulfide isomerase/thioredoxin
MRPVPAVTILLFALAGCLPTPAEPTPPQQVTPVAEAPVTEPPDGQSEPIMAPAPAAGALKIDILDWDQTQAIVATHPGKVVVFDLWSTYCPPCLKELPGLVALQDKYPDSVVCVSVSLDFDGDPKIPPSQLEPDIREVLEKVKAHKVRNVLLSTSSDDLFKVIEHQSMPIAYIFDQTGKRVAMFPDRKDPVEFTYAGDITPAVEKLLAEPAKP